MTRSHAGLHAVLKDWGFFALAALPGAMESVLGLGLVSRELSATAFGEWVVLLATMTVVGAASQLGMKTAYMQAVVDFAGLARQRQSLRAGILFLSLTGFAAGLVVALGLGLLSLWGAWDSVAVLPLLPVSMALTNAQMLLVTDLRIRRRLQWLTLMSVIQLPVFVGLLFALRSLGITGLLLIFLTSALVALARLLILWWIISPGNPIRARWGFIGPAVTLGFPIMLSLLMKYASDASVHMSVLWLGSEQLVGDWGRIQRILEPFNALYLVALLMAWGPNAILMAGHRSQVEVTKLMAASHRALWLCFAGLPVGLLWAYGLTGLIDGLSPSFPLGGWVCIAVLSRMLAFCAVSMANVGMVVARQYQAMVRLYGVEWVCSLLGVTAVLLLTRQVGSPHGEHAAIGAVALIPWIPVAWCYWRVSPRLLGLSTSRTMVSS